MKQIFHYSRPQPQQGAHGFAIASTLDYDAGVGLTIRQEGGSEAGQYVEVPWEEAVKMAEAILAAEPAKASETPPASE